MTQYNMTQIVLDVGFSGNKFYNSKSVIVIKMVAILDIGTLLKKIRASMSTRPDFENGSPWASNASFLWFFMNFINPFLIDVFLNSIDTVGNFRVCKNNSGMNESYGYTFNVNFRVWLQFISVSEWLVVQLLFFPLSQSLSRNIPHENVLSHIHHSIRTDTWIEIYANLPVL